MSQTQRPALGPIRQVIGLTQDELGRRTGYSRVTISRIETGDLRTSARFRQAVASAIGADEALIFGRPRRACPREHRRRDARAAAA